MKKIVIFLLSAIMAFACLGCKNGTDGSKPADGGNAKDPADFPFYVNADEAAYEFGFDEMTRPYFKGNVMYNETVLLTQENGVISGKLQYKPVKILSVRDYTWKNEFSASDYTVSGNVITAKAGSALPYLTSENLKGNDLPSQYRDVTAEGKVTNVLTDWMRMGGAIYTESPLFYGNQISVSYVFDINDLKTKEFASYETSGLTKTKAKLNGGEDLKISVIGDSVAEGCSSSKHFNHEPFMDNWATQVTQALNDEYDGEVTLSNVAVGGKTSDWGALQAQINKITAADPDLVMIHFGINDAGGDTTAGSYEENMEAIIAGVSAELPDCEFMLIKAFPVNPVSYDSRLFSQYWRRLDGLAQTYTNVYTLDMYTLGNTLLQNKKYVDVTANGINHVNDYSSRLYTMNILSALIKY